MSGYSSPHRGVLCPAGLVQVRTDASTHTPTPPSSTGVLSSLSAAPCRSELSLQPLTEEDADEQFECSEGFSYEDVSSQQPETRLQQTCRRSGGEAGVLMINMVPVKDAVTFRHTGDVGENFDVPFVLHLWPSILLRNLLPYPISYRLKVR